MVVSLKHNLLLTLDLNMLTNKRHPLSHTACCLRAKVFISNYNGTREYLHVIGFLFSKAPVCQCRIFNITLIKELFVLKTF